MVSLIFKIHIRFGYCYNWFVEQQIAYLELKKFAYPLKSDVTNQNSRETISRGSISYELVLCELNRNVLNDY